MNTKQEKVLCFKAELLQKLGYFQGINFEVNKYLPVLTDPANIHYIDRDLAENDPTYKQLIPYVMIVASSDEHDDQIFHYRRGKSGGESRLHDKWAVGVGGHIAITDADAGATGPGYLAGMRRELVEEVGTLLREDLPAIALINEDNTPVGKVHFGVVHVLLVEDELITSHCPDLTDAAFTEYDAAFRNIEAYEGWSRICLTHFHRIIRNAIYPRLA
jgi:predicted NUDIX family phosphoesterase